jgi:hypothetical protein
MNKKKIEVGTTHQFVLVQGFTKIGNHLTLELA